MKDKSNSSYAVITGASQGLGRAFAMELASRKKNIILVSLPNQNLREVANEIIEKYDVIAKYFETDFSSNENILTLCNWLNKHFTIDILINNAGIGGTRKFDDVDALYIDRIIQVNIKATSLLTHQLLSNLKKSKNAYILNVSSIAAFSPVGFKTVYPASKAFIHSFSRGLNAELKNTNIFISVINPGAMATNDEITSRINKQGFIGKLTLLKPEAVAKHAINRLLKRDSVIIVNPFTWLLSTLLPIWIKLPLMTQVVKREISYENNICYRN